jgi:uncharacterized protein (TIGR01777 family)
MMKVIITGGTGLIGRPLVKQLAGDGHQVVVLSRSPQKSRPEYPANVSFVGWDAKTVGAWAQEVDGANVVINLAGESIGGDNFLPDRWTAEKKKRIRQSRQDAGQVLVKAIEMAQQKPELLLQPSGVGYYGPQEDEWLTEESPPAQDFLASVCVDWESAVAGVQELGVRLVIMRIGLVQTMKGGPLTRMVVPFKFFVGGPYGNGRQWYSWVHLHDVVQAILFFIENKDISGPVNVVSPHPMTNKAFAKTLGRVMNRPSLIPVPAFAMRILTGEAALLVLGGQRVSAAHLQQQGFQFSFPDLEPALRDLLDRA